MSLSKFSIIPECNVLIEYYAGNVSLPHFLQLKEAESKHPLYSPSLSVITDIRHVDFHSFDKTYVESFVNFITSNPEFVATRKTVIITQTPNQVVWAQMFDDFIRKIGVHVHTVTSPSAAYSWLHIPIDKIPVIEKEHAKIIVG